MDNWFYSYNHLSLDKEASNAQLVLHPYSPMPRQNSIEWTTGSTFTITYASTRYHRMHNWFYSHNHLCLDKVSSKEWKLVLQSQLPIPRQGIIECATGSTVTITLCLNKVALNEWTTGSTVTITYASTR